jgi:hypothetical protein
MDFAKPTGPIQLDRAKLLGFNLAPPAPAGAEPESLARAVPMAMAGNSKPPPPAPLLSLPD